MHSCYRIAFLALFVLMAQSCARSTDSPASRRGLSYELLTGGDSPEQAWQLSEFARPVDAVAPRNRFSGRLRLDTDHQSNLFEILRDESGLVDTARPGVQELPPFDFEFVQDGDYLVPLQQGPIPGEHNWWEFVLRPGKVWDEDDDRGLTRAVIPFALKERAADCIHNGLMSFLFSDNGTVSKVAFQISTQTCRYLQFEMRGLLGAKYEPGVPDGAADVVAVARGNRESRLPQQPIAQLASHYAGVDAAEFGSTDEIDPDDMTVYGFIIDGIHYVGGCDTPYGTYPYCDELALPSYSTAKSLVGGLGLMLAEKSYPGTRYALISDYVPECGKGWGDVTIEHALDLVTGHYDSPEPHADEDAATVSRFFLSEDHAAKVDFACNEFPRKADPGEHWSYQTWGTYLAGTAINNRLKSIEGTDFDFYDDLLVEQLWKPLRLSQLIHSTRRTRDTVAQPYTGFGLTFVRDDIAKLAKFIGADDGRIEGRDVLDRTLFDAIKQRDPRDPGMRAERDTIFYNNGFRSYNVADVLGCGNPTWLVTMSGFGGINVVIMPNDTAYYYFSDGNVHRYLHAVRESHRIRSFCQ